MPRQTCGSPSMGFLFLSFFGGFVGGESRLLQGSAGQQSAQRRRGQSLKVATVQVVLFHR